MAIIVFNETQKKLLASIKTKNLNGIKKYFILQNTFIHPSSFHPVKDKNRADELWSLNINGSFNRFDKINMYSAAWHIWHSIRIEDICTSFFLLGSNQVFITNNYKRKLKVPYISTGNEFHYSDMEIFNKKIDLDNLLLYSIDVGKYSVKAVKTLTQSSIMSDIDPKILESIKRNGYVHPTQKWLLDFWGRKNIGEILIMPFTRHLLVHINSSLRQIKRISKTKNSV